jgi:hypothetical protein
MQQQIVLLVKLVEHVLFAELVRGRGYPLEHHTAVAADGYELTMFRIPHGRYRQA